MGPGYGNVQCIFTECGGADVLEELAYHDHREVSTAVNEIIDKFSTLAEVNPEMQENYGYPLKCKNEFLI
jgi:hypothetical protein